MRRFLIFTLGEGMFAINVGYAVEVLRSIPVKHIPEVPDFIEGVIKIRGHVFPVIDMRHRFGLPGRSERTKERILIVRSSLERIALIVDDVIGIETISRELIEKPPVVFQGIKKRYLEGLHSRENRVYIILNIEKILTSDEEIALQQAHSAMKGQNA